MVVPAGIAVGGDTTLMDVAGLRQNGKDAPSN